MATLLAHPAHAASSSADVTAPLRAAEASKATVAGDDQFRQLFNSWQSLDKGNAGAAAFAASSASTIAPGFSAAVSVPSRMPVDAVRQTSNFGMRWHPVLGGRRAHKGVDLSAPTGTPVYATADGMVGRADWFSSYGLYVAVEHGGALETRYGHLSRLNVAAGQMVHKGDVIGYVGSTGRSTGPHLHYEVRIAGEAVNPVPYLEGQGTAAPADLLAAAQGAPKPAAVEAEDEGEGE
ncbi:MAG: M23 family metallopeptidase [Proteobacteria bacterium]|nr:M23 family metallopeptidase [Pseudomonadota bacterium]